MVVMVEIDLSHALCNPEPEGQMENVARRDPVDTVRVRYWYEGVRRSVRSRTPYQLEKLLEPESFTKADGRTHYRNKWTRYAQGQHTPQQHLVDRVADRVLGSERELNHPLWSILKAERISSRQITTWIERLEPRVQTAIYRRPHDGQGAALLRLAYTSTLGRRLVKLGNLDALACLLLYWHESSSAGPDEGGRPAERIYQLLLILGRDFARRRIAEDIFMLFQTRVFARAVWEHGRLCMDGKLYQKSATVLYFLLSQVGGMPPLPSWAQQVRTMLHLLEGKQGFDVKFAMAPVWEPDWRLGPPTRETLDRWIQSRRLRVWGWSHLRAGTIGKFPPHDLLQARSGTAAD